MVRKMQNIILTGMPGSGKSTVGVILAKAINCGFVDTDLIIQQMTGRLLQDIIDKDGIKQFMKTEEEAICAANCSKSVISTGGSAVYSEKAMKKLKEGGVCVYLDVPVEELKRRISNMSSRGIVLNGSFEDTYAERVPLYEKYADITVKCDGMEIEETVSEIIRQLKENKNI